MRAPLLFLYNVLLNLEYKFLWVARWCVREVPRDRLNASEKRTSSTVERPINRKICIRRCELLHVHSSTPSFPVYGEWWNIFCSLQKHLINALVFLKKLCLSMH